jgi:hypothetical protein
VDTVSVAVTAPEVTLAELGDRLHPTPLAGLETKHERPTEPVKPLIGVRVMVEVPLLPAVRRMFPLLLRVNEGF